MDVEVERLMHKGSKIWLIKKSCFAEKDDTNDNHVKMLI